MRTIAFSLVLVLALAISGFAQTPPAPPVQKPEPAAEQKAPVVSEVDGLKLTNILLNVQSLSQQAELLQRQLVEVQEALPKAQETAKQFMTSLEKPGYEIRRGQNGEFIYVAKPPEPPAKSPEPKTEPKK